MAFVALASIYPNTLLLFASYWQSYAARRLQMIFSFHHALFSKQGVRFHIWPSAPDRW